MKLPVVIGLLALLAAVVVYNEVSSRYKFEQTKLSYTSINLTENEILCRILKNYADYRLSRNFDRIDLNDEMMSGVETITVNTESIVEDCSRIGVTLSWINNGDQEIFSFLVDGLVVGFAVNLDSQHIAEMFIRGK